MSLCEAPARASQRPVPNRLSDLGSTGPRSKAGKFRSALNLQSRRLAAESLEREPRARGADAREFCRLQREPACSRASTEKRALPPYKFCTFSQNEAKEHLWNQQNSPKNEAKTKLNEATFLAHAQQERKQRAPVFLRRANPKRIPNAPPRGNQGVRTPLPQKQGSEANKSNGINAESRKVTKSEPTKEPKTRPNWPEYRRKMGRNRSQRILEAGIMNGKTSIFSRSKEG